MQAIGACVGAIGCRNRACQVRSWSSEEAGLDLITGGGLDRLHFFTHMCASVVGVSVEPSVVGRDWSPMSSNKARGYCCRTPGGHRAPLQPRRAARRYLRVRGTSRSRADSRSPEARAGRAGLALVLVPPTPQCPRAESSPPIPAAAALVLYMWHSRNARTPLPEHSRQQVLGGPPLLASWGDWWTQ
jgi:hypothetical protein